ncbi:uncharacterized protein [Amphiura filiformis]|uniref:uncharacterized protein isoform X2 n=1 Tax=Amphiura filiformis TaxID=82378 RepID=UPI003B227236
MDIVYCGLIIFCVILSAQDGFGQPLSIRCPSNQTQDATPGLTFHQLTFPDPVVLSGSDVTFTQSPTFFEIGLRKVTFTARDSSGNTEMCSFYVNLRVPDDTPPSLICPANETEYLSAGQTSVSITLPPPAHAVDNSGGMVAISYNPPSGQAFSLGVTQVTITATDESDNSETCVFYVIIEQGMTTLAAPTTGRPTTTKATTTRPPTTTKQPTTTRPTTTNKQPTTTRPPTTTRQPATTRPPTTTKAPTTTRPPTTTKQPTTTRPPTTTKPPTTTRPMTTTLPPTTRPAKTTKSPTTTKPTTTTRPPTTTKPPPTTKSPTTTRPSTTTKPPATTRPPTTTRKPSTTRPTTKPMTTAPVKTTKRMTTKGRPFATDIMDICNPNPCNNGLCLKDATNSIISCVCFHGYMGNRCELSMSTAMFNRNTTETPLASGGPPMSAIIAVIIAALAFILMIFIILTAIICCYNRDSERPTGVVLKEKPEGNANPVFILDALDVEEEEKRSIASHELVHVDNDYVGNKTLRTEGFRTPDETNRNGEIKPKANTVTFAEDQPLVDAPPDEPDYDDVASSNSDHSYQSIDIETRNKIIVEVDNHLPEADREEASKEAAMLEDILNREGLVRIPSTTSTNYSTMSVKLRDSRLNSRYIKKK